MNQRRESSGWDWWMKDKVKKIKVELIAKELGDVGTTPSKTSLYWNIRGEPREPVNPSSVSPVTRDSYAVD